MPLFALGDVFFFVLDYDGLRKVGYPPHKVNETSTDFAATMTKNGCVYPVGCGSTRLDSRDRSTGVLPGVADAGDDDVVMATRCRPPSRIRNGERRSRSVPRSRIRCSRMSVPPLYHRPHADDRLIHRSSLFSSVFPHCNDHHSSNDVPGVSRASCRMVKMSCIHNDKSFLLSSSRSRSASKLYE